MTIPDNTAVVTINDDGSSVSGIAVTMPAGVNGQMLYIYNADAQATTGTVIASGATAHYVYAAGGWHRIS